MKSTAILAGLCLAVVLVACTTPPQAVGRRIFNNNCTACHGQSGRGDGPLAGQLDNTVPDLTLISQKNDGTFPMAEVLSTIDGYTRAREGNTVMPEFGIDLQAGPLVYLDTGDGITTPTPSRLIAIAEYIRSIQR